MPDRRTKSRIAMGDAGRKLAIVLMAVGLTVAPALSAGQINLPDMGSPADAVLSKNEENRIGRAIMAQIRASGEIVDDPQVTEYINEIGYRIAAQANVDGKHEFTFFVVDSPVVNAFALPGGFIGVHTGLLEATRNEDELAGVLAHEVAHVTQRHIARRIHATQRQSILSTAIMLGAILAGAAGGASSDVMQGAIAVAQGTAAQQQINFTRTNEYEADRVGISALAAAGFDPQGMASFFEVISRGTTPHEHRVPEFLRTHPVSSARIAEARGRARNYEPVHTADSITYGIAKARLIISAQDTPELAVTYFEREAYEYQSDVERYGRAMAYLRAGSNEDANRIFEELVSKDPKVIAYHIGLADSLPLRLVAPRPFYHCFTSATAALDRETSSSGVIGKTVLAVPPAPQTKSYCNKSSSIRTVHGLVCPKGGTPPGAYPVFSMM